MQIGRRDFLRATVAVAGASGARRAISAEPVTIRFGFASIGAGNRQFAGGSSAATAHAEHYLEAEFGDRPNVQVAWSFFKGAGPAVQSPPARPCNTPRPRPT